jgi:hypothetical protein
MVEVKVIVNLVLIFGVWARILLYPYIFYQCH